MKIKPIILRTPEVRDLLDTGRAVVRRGMKPQQMEFADGQTEPFDSVEPVGNDRFALKFRNFTQYVSAPYRPGDMVYVKEKWRCVDFEYCDGKWSASIEYADGQIGPRVFWYDNTDVGIPDDSPYSRTGWRSSVHMPRAACRMWAMVEAVRPEHVESGWELVYEIVRAERPEGWE